MTTRSTQAVNGAVRAAAERGNPAVEPAHLAVALLDDAETLTRPVLQAVGADPMQVRADMQRLVDALPSASGASVAAPQTSRRLVHVVEWVWRPLFVASPRLHAVDEAAAIVVDPVVVCASALEK